MRTFLIGLPVLFALSAVTPLNALDNEGLEALSNATTLRCQLEEGVSAPFEDGRWKPKKSRWDIKNPTIFDSIDSEAKKARLIGNIGAADVTVALTPQGLYFLEWTLAGALNVMMVYPQQTDNFREFPAVHSRHVGGFGTPPLPSQFYGTCTILESAPG